MDYSHIAFLLAALGLALLAAEFFIPSGGLILISALISLVVSIWCAWQAWWLTSPMTWWLYLGSLVVLAPFGVISAVYLMPRTALGRRLFVAPQAQEDLTPYLEEEKHLSSMIDQTGKTLTRLAPGGLVSINGERLHCESEGMMIDSGTIVKVVAVTGNRLLVRLMPAESDSRPEPASNEDTQSTKPWLDFDVPPS
jgi:membrane-bound ClpP family serine protease